MDSGAVLLPVAGVELAGDLVLPSPRRGLVLFAHGSGSSRFSSRNRFVAAVLQRAGLATLLFDLLTAAEERRDRVDAALRFDIPLLSQRLVGAIDWVAGRPQLSGLPLGLPQVRCPTLLIVGGRDPQVLQLNRQAAAALRAPHALELVPGASHLFEEPGTLAAASRLACDWFLEHLAGGDAGGDPGAAAR